jgi:hypothetical protein
VDGFGNNRGLEDDSSTVIIGGDEEVTIEPSPPTLTAQLVNTKDEENRAVQNFLQNAAVADVVPEVAPNNSGRLCILASIFLVLILIVVGVVLARTLLAEESTPVPTGAPVPTEVFLKDLLSSVSSDGGEALSTSSTPQNKAFNWMVTNNTNLVSFSNETIIQRYALATLYYSTDGDSWDYNEFWLDDGNECGSWKTYNGQLACTGNGTATQLNLRDNNLKGKIPLEIGLLSELGKFIMEEQRMTMHSTHHSIQKLHCDSILPSRDLSHAFFLCCKLYSTVELWLSSNALEGFIPSEVGALTQLGKYTHDCCQHALTQVTLEVSIPIHLVILMTHFDCLSRLSTSSWQ